VSDVSKDDDFPNARIITINVEETHDNSFNT
jgi:hypothetical protein